MKSGKHMLGVHAGSENGKTRQCETDHPHQQLPRLKKSETDNYAMSAKTGYPSAVAIMLNWAQGVGNTRIRTMAITDPADLVSLQACQNRSVKSKSWKNFL